MESLEITQKVRRASISWLLTMQEEYGNEVAMKCYDVMREGFGEDLAGAVLFGIMTNNHGDTLRIRWVTNTINDKIRAIKAVRAISGLGLGEAKNLVEAAASDEMQVKIKNEMEHDIIRAYIVELEEAGVHVR